MGYYRGDGANYYRGDYYRGDPFLGALAGAALGKVAGAVGRGVGRLIGGARRAAPTVLREAAPTVVSGAVGLALGRRSQMAMPSLGPMTGAAGAGPDFFAAPRRRRMNPLNPKALRRALRRAEGFEKFAKKTVNALYKTVDGRRVRTYKKRGSA